MKFKGVTDKEQDIINNIVKLFTDKYKFYLYGSRVKGDFSKVSDLDVMIKGVNKAEYEDIETLKTLCDNSDLPYIVNFSDYHNLDEHFYNLIKDDLVKIEG